MSWSTAALGDVCDIVSGATPKSGEARFWGGDISWTTPKDLGELETPYLDDPPRRITLEGLKSCAASLLPVNSVLLSSRAPIGLVAINTRPMATNQGFKSLVPDKQQLDSKFLFHWLKANTAYLQSLGNGATFKEISKAVVERIEIPLPPLDEQQRIAAILDKADALRRKRKRALELLDGLTQSIFLEMFGDPIANPKRLPRAALKDIAGFVGGATPSKGNASYWVGNIPWVSPKDMKRDEIFDAEDHVNEGAIEASALKLIPAASALIVIRGMILAHTFPVAMAKRELTINQDMKAILFREKIAPEIGIANIRAARSYILSKVATAAHGTKRIEMDDIRSVPVLIPPLQEQQKFVEATARIEELRLASAAAFSLTSDNFSSLQHRAFTGQL